MLGTSESEPDELLFTSDEILLLVALLKMHEGSIAITLGCAVRSGALSDNDEMCQEMILFWCVVIEKVSQVMDGERGVFTGIELPIEQLIIDACEE